MNLEQVKALPPASQYSQMVTDMLKDMGSPIATAIHAALGVSGEVAETLAAIIRKDADNMIEEMGDIHFYGQGLLNLYGWQRIEVMYKPANAEDANLADFFGVVPEYAMVYYAGQIIDQLKKTWAYNKELDLEALKYNVGMFYNFFEEQLQDNGLTFDDIEAHNQYKLVTGPKARYPSGKYSDAAAQARADKVVDTVAAILSPVKLDE